MTVLTAAQQDGFALAALLANDRSLQQVERALCDESAAQLRNRLAVLAAGERAQLVAQLLERVRPPLVELDRALPARLIALLAARLPRRSAALQQPARSSARAGFVLSPALLPLLLRLARAHAERCVQAAGPAREARSEAP
jgi:hypothetical protein